MTATIITIQISRVSNHASEKQPTEASHFARTNAMIFPNDFYIPDGTPLIFFARLVLCIRSRVPIKIFSMLLGPEGGTLRRMSLDGLPAVPALPLEVIV